MPSKNSITGDPILTSAYSSQGRKNHDRIFSKKSANECLKDETYIVYDADGFNWKDGVTMDTPISYAEFQKRINHCTILRASFKKYGN